MTAARWVFSDDPTVWLNWVQGVTTIVLAGLTGFYLRRTNTLTEQQAKAAADAVAIARKQLDADLLAKYVPIQSAVSAAIGQVRGRRAMPMNVGYTLAPPNFEAAVRHAETVGASMASVMRVTMILLEQAQTYNDDLRKASEKFEPGHLQIEFNLKTLTLYLDALERTLVSVYEELTPRIQQLRESTGYHDLKGTTKA